MIRKLLVMALLVSCGHTSYHQLGLISVGALEGKQLPAEVTGEVLQGKSCGYSYYLSEALRDAVKETEYDTLVDVTVTSETGLLVTSNCVRVSGKALDSKKLGGKNE